MRGTDGVEEAMPSGEVEATADALNEIGREGMGEVALDLGDNGGETTHEDLLSCGCP